jgi:hypothetical protein
MFQGRRFSSVSTLSAASCNRLCPAAVGRGKGRPKAHPGGTNL